MFASPALPCPVCVCVCCGLLLCVCVCVRVPVCVWHHLLGQKSLLGYQCHKLLEYADPVARRKRPKTARKREREEGVRGRGEEGRRLMRH